MKREVGLWIDHHKAVIVTLLDEKEETREIRSNLEKPVSLSGKPAEKKPVGSTVPNVKAVSDRSHEDQLNGFYAGLVSLLRNADSIWIFGPGEAKTELKKRLDLLESDGRVIDVEDEHKMTDRQIVAKVRQHYQQ